MNELWSMDYLLYTSSFIFIFVIIIALWIKKDKCTKTVCIVVFGDIGRSPRMQYHAASFVKEGYFVEIIGYPGSPPLKELRHHPHVKIYYLTSPPNLDNSLTRIISYAIKVIWQSVNLLFSLFTKCNASFILLQNPPAIPTIPICWIYCYATRAKYIIDWHNYGHTIMALSLGENHFIVRLASYIESFFGTCAMYNFCVTKAMQEDLNKKWNIKAKVLYDRPSEEFHPISLEEKHQLFFKLSKTYSAFRSTEKNSTIFTMQRSTGEVVLHTDRPALIVSSTSWTEDEDFSILLDALHSIQLI